MTRVLLTTVYRPFCGNDPFDSPKNLVQHGVCHRHFTREQGAFSIHQQCSHLALHLIAANIEAETDILEYPSLDEFQDALGQAVREDRPYDYVGVTCVSSYVRKARHLCELAKQHSPGSATIVGGGGVLAIGELVEPFSDHTCRGDGVRFFRELLGQDPEASIDHPTVPSVHFPNQIMAWRGNPVSYSLAVSLGCERRCDFCATSAHFAGRRVPILSSATQIFLAMRRVETDLKAAGETVPTIQFAVFDENFLTNEKVCREFQQINREQLKRGTQYLLFLFADAASLSRFTAVDLLEMGVDSVWVGMESGDDRRFSKNRGVDFRRLVSELQDNGIKVFISFIAGLEDQTAADMDRDAEYALSFGAAGFQYGIACPLPGTAYYDRLKREGRLSAERPEQLNMSHYYIRHPEVTDEQVREKTVRFLRRDYERHGPLALRYMQLRLQGYLRHR
ncbi:B12-binding domain-containing radical SAM protein, partial [Planctomycetota bacterium]